MSADSERLTPTYTEQGLINMPALAGYRHGDRVQIRESSLAEAATIWIQVRNDDDPPGTDRSAAMQLTLDKAAGLRDQLDVLIRQHRLAVVPDSAEEPETEIEPTWRPVRVNAEGQILAITDEHGERLSIQPAPCPACGQNSLFKGPTRTLCASCGRSS